MIAANDHIVLHRVTLAHAAFLQRLMNEPSWLANIGDRGIRSLADAERFIQTKVWPVYVQRGFGMYVLARPQADTPLGVCGLFQREALRLPDLGFALLPEYWGQGLAYEGAALLLHHAQAQLDLPRVLAITAQGNARSARLLDRLGFRFQGQVQLAADDAPLRVYERQASAALR